MAENSRRSSGGPEGAAAAQPPGSARSHAGDDMHSGTPEQRVVPRPAIVPPLPINATRSFRNLPPGVRTAGVAAPKVQLKLARRPSRDVVIRAADPSEEEHKAATRIQAIARGRQARQRVKAMPRPPPPPARPLPPPPAAPAAAPAPVQAAPSQAELDAAATRIQSIVRGRQVRQKPLPPKRPPGPPPAAPEPVPAAAPAPAPVPVVAPPAPDPAAEHSAVKMQSLFRGYRSRKSMPKKPAAPPVRPAHVPLPDRPNAPLPPVDAPVNIPRPPSAHAPLPAQPPQMQPPPPTAVKEKPNIPQGAGARAQLTALQQQIDELTFQLKEAKSANAKLSQQLDETKDTLGDKVTSLQIAQERVEELEHETQVLEDQIQQEHKDFEELQNILQDKDDVLTTRINELLAVQQELHTTKTLLKKQRETTQHLQERIKELTPETTDAACSARSIDESIQLQLRDESLRVKDTQIEQLTIANQKYMENLSQVESEVQRLQGDLVEKDAHIAKQKSQISELKKEVARLGNIIKNSKGQEYAMDVAAKQNTQLLQLLEAAEKTAADAQAEKAEALAQAMDAKLKLLEAIKDSATHEAVATTESRDARQLARQVTVLQTKLDTTVTRLSTELRATQEQARAQTEAIQEELRLRREKQYELLDRLQKTEELARAETMRADDLDAKNRALSAHVLEMESTMLANKQWRNEEAAESIAAAKRAKELEITLRERVKRAEEDREATNKQMMDMGQTVVRLAERQRLAEDKASRAEEDGRSKQGEITVLKERVAQLIDEGLRAQKARQHVERERDQLAAALKQLEEQHGVLSSKTQGISASRHAGLNIPNTGTGPLEGTDTLGGGWKGNAKTGANDPTDGMRELELQRKLRNAQALCDQIRASKRLVLVRAVHLYCRLMAVSDPPPDVPLPLASVGLDDEDVAVIVETLSRPAPANPFDPLNATSTQPVPMCPVTTMDLRSNVLTDAAALLLTSCMNGSGGRPGATLGSSLCRLDLRGNAMSQAGVRALAESLRSNLELGVRHVYVSRAGLIQALGAPPGSTSGDVGVVAVVDVSENRGGNTGDAATVAQEMRSKMRASVMRDTASSSDLPLSASLLPDQWATKALESTQDMRTSLSFATLPSASGSSTPINRTAGTPVRPTTGQSEHTSRLIQEALAVQVPKSPSGRLMFDDDQPLKRPQSANKTTKAKTTKSSSSSTKTRTGGATAAAGSSKAKVKRSTGGRSAAAGGGLLADSDAAGRSTARSTESLPAIPSPYPDDDRAFEYN